MKLNLIKNDKTIAAEKPRATVFYLNDGGGLRLRVRPNGSKTWILRYKVAGVEHQHGLGDYPTVTLARAREKAHEARAGLDEGKDPIAGKKAAAKAVKAEIERAKTNTVKALAEEWARVDLSTRKDGGAGALRALDRDAWPTIGDMPPEDVKTAHVLEIVDAMRARGVTRTTSVVFAELRQMFRWATMRERIPKDPTYGLDKGKVCAPSPPRQRVLSDDEIVWLAARIEGAISRRARLVFLLLLATGNRIGETLAGEWKEINFEKAEWLIPAPKRKGNARHPARDHLVFLSDFALAVLAGIGADAGDDARMFPDTDAKNMTKAFTDRQTDPKTATRKRRLLSTDLLPQGGHWTPHDARRTARTLLARLGVDGDVAEKCIGHAESSKIVATYNVHDYATEKREAMSKLGDFLAGLLTPAKPKKPAKAKKPPVICSNEFARLEWPA
jgi:integrase